MKKNVPLGGFSSPQHAHLLESETHLWFLDLTELDESHLAEAINLLSAQEIQRAESFKRRKAQHILTRAFLRKSLARYCHSAAEKLDFVVDTNGKPHLTNCTNPLSFNLSHSGDFVVLAVGAQNRVGVDIEVTRPRDFIKIAEHYFHPQEVHALVNSTAKERTTLFFELWTRKEAFLKALGGGISTGLDKIYFDLLQQPKTFYLSDSLGEKVNEWAFFSTQLNHQIFVSVASEQNSPLSIRWFDGSSLFLG